MVTSPSLSPDGRRVAVDSPGPDGNLNIWTLETDRGLRSRLTLHSPPTSDFSQVWSPDGNSIAFSSNVEVAACPWNGQHRLVRIGLKGKEIASEKRPDTGTCPGLNILALESFVPAPLLSNPPVRQTPLAWLRRKPG